MCGKALPFRLTPTASFLGSSRLRLEELKSSKDSAYGKAKPYRTSGGRAAHADSRILLSKFCGYNSFTPATEKLHPKQWNKQAL
jgi:hypothetical protein